MRSVNPAAKRLLFEGEEGDVLEVHYANRGEPFREGAQIEWRLSNWRSSVSVFLQRAELEALRDTLNELLLSDEEAARKRKDGA